MHRKVTKCILDECARSLFSIEKDYHSLELNKKVLEVKRIFLGFTVPSPQIERKIKTLMPYLGIHEIRSLMRMWYLFERK